MFAGTFPVLNLNSTIEYFITATSILGDMSSHPNAGWHVFETPNSILGDLNLDNDINILDVIILVNHILSSANVELDGADINNDGDINILDIVSLVNIILQ